MDIDQIDLMRRLVQKDQDALALLLQVYGPKLKGWLRARFGAVLQSAEIDEALSVTAYNAWRFADRYAASRAPLEAWLIAIAGNAARSILRSETRHRRKQLEYDERYDPAWDPDTEKVTVELRRRCSPTSLDGVPTR
jgi:DNA-directed RNA polymerase specialized sigma24 family protein